MTSVADRLGLKKKVTELRLGKSFSGNGGTTFHSIRYDFKPASVDNTKRRTVDIGEGNQVTVTVPHIEGSAHTVFRGSKKPYQKECVLIIDHTTGEICLEKLNCNIQLKKTRAEGSSRIQPRPITPIDSGNSKKPSPNQKYSPSTQKPTPSTQKSHSPSQKATTWPSSASHYSPSQRISPHLKTSPNDHSPASQPSPSMPCLLGPSNGSSRGPSLLGAPPKPPPQPPPIQHVVPNSELREAPAIGVLSDSSSDSGGSSSNDDSSSSDSEPEKVIPVPVKKHAVKVNGSSKISNPLPSMPKFSQLSEDLQLSESGSDSD